MNQLQPYFHVVVWTICGIVGTMVVLYFLSRLKFGPELKVFLLEMALVVAIINLLAGKSLEEVLGVPAIIFLVAVLPWEYPADVTKPISRYPWRTPKAPEQSTKQGDP